MIYFITNLIFFFSDSSTYYPSSDNSFYDTYDPFEYLTAQTERVDEVDEQSVRGEQNIL